jgi:hypothetical protein
VSLAKLRRFARAADRAERAGHPRVVERCDLCGAALSDGHGHLVELGRRSLACACRPCHLLFTRDGAGAGRYRAVPQRYLTDAEHPLTDDDWNELGIPVATAFLFTNSDLDRVVAGYPSPAGVTECLLDAAAWDRLRRAYPLLAASAADVEAVYVTRAGDRLESFLVPIDTCFALAGEIRLRWHGLDGGEDVRRALSGFLDDLRARSRPLRAEGTG